ncbi:MAG: ribonuclease HII [Bacteroidetes bacterium]|nr:ribonuclease HII [Bacteroidota bacterium]
MAKTYPALAPCLESGRTEAGVDEAGRGALAGPVVAAAVILPPDFTHPLVRDSKTLNPAQREEAREVVLHHALCWGLGILSVEEIDRQNILQAAISAMHQAVDQLHQAPDWLLVDGNRFRSHRIPHTCVVKGDGKLMSIAAASILAKTYRDDMMRLLHIQHPYYGWATNMGYPTPPHRRAIAERGPTAWHRQSFKLLPPVTLFDDPAAARS